jgi:hypothetical protein
VLCCAVLCLAVVLQVRAIGRLLNVPETFIKRHPFPGPGMGVRILGDVTEGDRLEVRGGEYGKGGDAAAEHPTALRGVDDASDVAC